MERQVQETGLQEVNQTSTKKRGRRKDSTILTINTKKGRLLIYKILYDAIKNAKVYYNNLSNKELELVKRLIQEKHAKIVEGDYIAITQRALIHILKLDNVNKTKSKNSEEYKEVLLSKIKELSENVKEEEENIFEAILEDHLENEESDYIVSEEEIDGFEISTK